MCVRAQRPSVVETHCSGVLYSNAYQHCINLCGDDAGLCAQIFPVIDKDNSGSICLEEFKTLYNFLFLEDANLDSIM